MWIKEILVSDFTSNKKDPNASQDIYLTSEKTYEGKSKKTFTAFITNISSDVVI